MPRKARIDAPGALHHIIIRGIERRRIFTDDLDRDNLIEWENYQESFGTQTMDCGCFGKKLDKVALRVSSELGIDPEQVSRTGKNRLTVKARSLLCYWAVSKFGFSATELSKKLGVSQPAASIAVKRGEQIARVDRLELEENCKVIILWASTNLPSFCYTRFR